MAPEDFGPSAATPGALLNSDRDLATLLPFEGLTTAQVEDILSKATLRQIPPNATFFHEGDGAENFYVLLDGVLRILRTTDDGEQVVLLHIAPGQLFGIARAYDNDTYHATANAASAGLALGWPSDLWDAFIREYPGFLDATRKAVGTRVDEMQEKIVDMATLQVEQRIAQAIVRLIQRHGRQIDGGIEIGFPITRQDISEMTGTTLHSVSRYLSKWQKAGIVSSSRRRVVVCRSQDLPV